MWLPGAMLEWCILGVGCEKNKNQKKKKKTTKKPSGVWKLRISGNESHWWKETKTIHSVQGGVRP